jgi:DNA-binding transcriptional MerR regulator
MAETMRIGALAGRTGTAPRLLRYYEEQGLIRSRRADNGYRLYDEEAVDRVLQVRGLLDAGLPTRVIREILPCLSGAEARYCPTTSPALIATLERERDRMNRRIGTLTENRDALEAYLAAIPVPESDAAAA